MNLIGKIGLILVASSFLGGNIIAGISSGDLTDEVVKGAKPTLRVMTYNIAAGANNFDVDLDKTAEAILSIDPDIIALQEVDNKTERSGRVDQIEYLAKKTGYNYVYGKALDFDGGEYGIAIMSKHEISLVDIQQLPSGDEEQRVALYTSVKVDGFKAPITYIATHLDWHSQPDTRKGQAYALLEKSIDMNYGLQILAGDFNSVPSSETIRIIKLHWNPAYGDDKTRTWPALNPRIRIDYIFTSNAQVWRSKSFVPVDNRSVQWSTVSDHLPVVTDLTLLEY